MIVLLSALAVVAAAIVLVVGMVTGAFSLIYAGLALAAIGVVLLLVARLLGRSRDAALSEEPEPLPAAAAGGAAPGVGELVEDPEAAFPIPRYDSLWVTQIVPHLAGLSTDDLAMVEARERGGRHRSGVLDAIAAARRGDAVVPTTETDDVPENGPPARRVRSDDLASDPAAEGEDEDDVFVSEVASTPDVPSSSGDQADEDAPGAPAVPADTEPPMDAVVVDGSAYVPTFLGRPAAPITVRRT